MPRAMWSGSISFGLISLPVKAYSATRRERIDFDLLHDEDGGKIEYKRVCAKDHEEVPWEDIIRGYEIEPGRYVTFTKDELEALQPDKTRTIDIEDFVKLDEIDPMLYDSPYYLLPEPGAMRAYELLHQSMDEMGVVAVARVVMRTRQRLVAIRPLEDGMLSMETLHFAAEVREAPEMPERPEQSSPSKREVTMARSLIKELTVPFDAGRYPDTYRTQVLELIERKSEGEVIESPVSGEQPSTAANDIMAALEASLAAAKKPTRKRPQSARRPSKRPATKR